MEENMNKYSQVKLNLYTYRELQRIAKGMDLPSNVKKVHLIELIHAKQFKSQDVLNEIINYVRLERLEKSAAKRRHFKKCCIQKSEVSSTCNKSPPITETPNRLKSLIDHTKVKQKLLKCNEVQSNLKTSSTRVTPIASDRVLRSFRKRPNYRRLTASSLFDVIKTPNPKPIEVDRGSQETSYPLFNLLTVDDNLTSMALDIPGGSQLDSISTTDETRPVNNRVRKISGVSPVTTPERSTTTYFRTMNFIDQNGRMTKLKALIKRPLSLFHTNTSNSLLKNNNKQGSNVLVRLVKESGISNPNDEGNVNNTYKVDLIIEKSQNAIEDNVIDANLNPNDDEMEMNQIDNEPINAESETVDNCVNDILQSTDNVLDDGINSPLLEPISVEVSEDAERTQTSPSSYMGTNSATDCGVLEYVYNYKNQFMASSDWFQNVTTASNTSCVYSTCTVTTPIQQPPASIINEYNACGNDLSMQDNEYTDGTLYELLPFDIREETAGNEFICNEVLNSSTSVDTNGNEVSGTIPEMVEDALEIINQDEDYMGSISVESGMQCFLCPWFGAKSLLDSHFRQYHLNEIETCVSEELVITYTLGSLVQRDAWSCRVVQYDSELYVLSAKYEDPDIFLASINAFIADGVMTKLAKITTFNKLTGEPFLWMGPVYEIPDTIPFHDKSHCFRLELSKMNLLPDSTNLRQLNDEPVIEAPKKVIVGQPALNDIHINLFIKLSNIITL